MPRIQVEIHESIAHLPYIESLKNQFIAYKSTAYSHSQDTGLPISEFLPTLSMTDQMEFPPDHEMFGKDKLFEGPDRAIKEQVYHVHLYRPNHKDTKWHSEKNPLVQWKCTSDSALVYSHIETDTEDSIFLFIRIMDPGAHDAYKQPGLVEKWAKLSQDYRTSHRR